MSATVVQVNQPDPLGERVIRKYHEARTLRAPHEGDWREALERLGLSGTLTGLNTLTAAALTSQRNPKNFVDTVGAKALDRFKAMLEMMLTPRQQKWHGIKASDASLNRSRRVRLYFEQVRDALFTYRYAARARFSSAQQESYESLGAIGYGVKFIEAPRQKDEPGTRGLRYRSLDPSRTYILVDYAGNVSHMLREIDLNARQSRGQFGEENLPKPVLDELRKEGGPSETTMFRYIHMVGPNDEYDGSRLDYRGMRYKSCHVHEQTKQVVREGGYHTWPYPVSRAPTTAERVYARSPAMKAMGAIKTANEIKVTLLQQGQRTVKPVLLTHDDGVLDTFDLRPGAQNRGGVNAEGKELVKTLPVGRVDVGHDMLDREHRDVNDIFYVTLFLLLMETPEMTATEVIQRLRERGALLSPLAGTIEDEDLSATVEREIDLLEDQGLLPEPPPELIEAGGEYTLRFVNPFNQAQQSDQITSYIRLRGIASEQAAMTKDPRPLQRFNDDAFIPDAADRMDIPPAWIRTDEQMAEIDRRAQEQQDTATAIEAAPAIAGLAKAAGQMGAGASA